MTFTPHCPKGNKIFPRYNMKCSRENVILCGIFPVVLCFPLHFIVYRGNLDYFSDSASHQQIFIEFSIFAYFFLTVCKLLPPPPMRHKLHVSLFQYHDWIFCTVYQNMFFVWTYTRTRVQSAPLSAERNNVSFKTKVCYSANKRTLFGKQ